MKLILTIFVLLINIWIVDVKKQFLDRTNNWQCIVVKYERGYIDTLVTQVPFVDVLFILNDSAFILVNKFYHGKSGLRVAEEDVKQALFKSRATDIDTFFMRNNTLFQIFYGEEMKVFNMDTDTCYRVFRKINIAGISNSLDFACSIICPVKGNGNNMKPFLAKKVSLFGNSANLNLADSSMFTPGYFSEDELVLFSPILGVMRSYSSNENFDEVDSVIYEYEVFGDCGHMRQGW